MQKWFRCLLAVVLLSISLSGCAAVKTEAAYSVYPVGYLLQRLGSGVITAESVQTDTIVQKATVADNYQEILDRSAIFFHIGQLEPYLTVYDQEIAAHVSSQQDLSILNAVYDNKRYTEALPGDSSLFVESSYYDGEIFDSIDMDSQDLYLWLDPIAMLSMAKNVRDWLKQTYSEYSSVFDTNFTSLETDLINIDAQYQALATSLDTNNQMIRFVSMSNSFGSWQKTYGFQVYPVVLSKYGVLPDSRQLAAIEERIKTDGVKYIVYEPNMTQDMIDLFNQIETDLGLTRVELSNLSSLTTDQETEGRDYVSIMYENLSVLQSMVEDRPEAPSSSSSDAGETTETTDGSADMESGTDSQAEG